MCGQLVCVGFDDFQLRRTFGFGNNGLFDLTLFFRLAAHQVELLTRHGKIDFTQKLAVD